MASVDLQEKANFTRLTRLLIDKGTEALKNEFDAIHPPVNLQAVLAGKRAFLLYLNKKRRVISHPQWDLLFPPSGSPPDSKTFDVTLLTVLFRNICGLPKTGWDAMPPDTDRLMQANIVRLKFLRNEIYAHVSSTQVDDATFKYLWQTISQVLVELKIPQNDIDYLETSPLGPEEVEIRKEYLDILKEWKSQEERLEEIEQNVKRLRTDTEKHGDEIKGLQSSFTHHLEETCSKESDDHLLQKLRKHNFESKIGHKLEFFHPGSREWLLQQVNKFVEKEQKSRMLLLTAGPGFGKSVFAAKVCDVFKKKGKLAASHFCDFSTSILRDPMVILESLARHMCENIAGFKEKLLDQLRQPHNIQSLKDAFTIYFQNPLDELDLEEPSLVVIDGLDECAADKKNEIMKLIADNFHEVPKCIKFLVTSRPQIFLKELRGFQEIDIDSNNASNNSDLELYLEACLPRLADKKAESPLEIQYRSVCNKLAEKCEGSFLYAFYAQSGLLKRDDLDEMTFNEIIEFVPKDLHSVYLAYFNRLEDELRAITHGNLDVLRILEMLAASTDPLPLSFISRALGLAPDNLETRKMIDEAREIIGYVNQTVSCLLYVSDDLVTVFHKSVIDWLLAEGYKDHKYAVKVMDGNKSLWLICEKVFEEIKETIYSGHDLNLTNDVKYALTNGFDYLGAWSMEKSLVWSVDVVIIHVWLTIYPKTTNRRGYTINYILNLWGRILQGRYAVISDRLRELLLWHDREIDLVHDLELRTRPYYLQSVLTHSPKGYFSDKEKEIAESLSSKVPRFVEYNCNEEVDVLLLGAWRKGSRVITDVGLSHDKTMAAVVDQYMTISVISVPSLVELWQHCIRGVSSHISCCTFAADDSFVLFGKLETVLNIAEKKEKPFFPEKKETFTSCAFSPNGKRLITSNGSKIIKLWDVAKQSLLASLCADAHLYVNWCSFSSTGLFIIGGGVYDQDAISYCGSEDSDSDYEIHDERFDPENSFCVWNAITWQRSDERNIRDVKLMQPGVFQDKKCKRCFRPAFNELNSSNWSTPTGIYNGVECSFCLKDHTLSVIESTHFTTLAAWNLSTRIYDKMQLTTIEDDLWFYADDDKLYVFRTLPPTHQQSSRLPSPTRVLSSSFSPDGSRLATCTSDGYINIWNVHTGQVEESFKRKQGDSSFACWWSEKFLFVFDFFDRIPSLSKYLVNVNLKVAFHQSQQVSLSHLLEEFVSLSAIVDFSEGLLRFECGKTEPVKVLDVSGVGEPRMVTLPGIKSRMNIIVSPGASFVFGGNKSTYYIWKRNAKEELDVYDVFFTEPCEYKITHSCCFSNDSKVAVLGAHFYSTSQDLKIFDLVARSCKSVSFSLTGQFGLGTPMKFFCLNDRVLIHSDRNNLKFLDMDSGARLWSSFQRYLTRDSLKQLKLSPDETMLAFPKINGDMEFLRLCIPQGPLLSSMKRVAAAKRR